MDEYVKFMADFYEFSGIDLSRYKRPQMERRLTALAQKVGHPSFAGLFQACQDNPAVLSQLLDKMTINVSEFFRNPDRWEELQALLAQHHNTVRIWSAACATGEEPYTLAILMQELLHQPYEITATDIDMNVLASARLGLYKEHQVKSVPNSLREKCFENSEDVWKIHPTYRQHIRFEQHNLLSDTYPRDFDLIVCRNVLIYFTEEAKKHILRKFSEALRPMGILFVGSTEQIFSPETYGLKLLRPFMYQKQPV